MTSTEMDTSTESACSVTPNGASLVEQLTLIDDSVRDLRKELTVLRSQSFVLNHTVERLQTTLEKTELTKLENQSDDSEEDFTALVNKLTNMGVHIRGSTTRMSQKITQATDLIFNMTLSAMESCEVSEEVNKEEGATGMQPSSEAEKKEEVKVESQKMESCVPSNRNIENILLGKLDTILTVVKRNNENLECIRNNQESNSQK